MLLLKMTDSKQIQKTLQRQCNHCERQTEGQAIHNQYIQGQGKIIKKQQQGNKPNEQKP